MLKSRKILVSLIIVSLVVLAFGSVKSLATQPISVNVANTTTDNSVGTQIQVNTNSTNSTNSTNTTLGATTNNAVSGTVSNNVNNTANSTSYNTTKNTVKSSLPYAGTSSSTVLIIIALVISAVYAYKKVSDYNV